jgi:hypothetical protein
MKHSTEAEAMREGGLLSEEEFMEKYGDVKVRFMSYQHFAFVYFAELEGGGEIEVIATCCAEDTYFHNIKKGESKTIRELQPIAGAVTDDSGKNIHTYLNKIF